PLALLLLSHARPDVRAEDVDAARSFARVTQQLGLATGDAGSGDRGRVRVVALRRRRGELQPELRAHHHQRGADVVSVAEPGNADALEAAEPLADRHRVGERLARMR